MAPQIRSTWGGAPFSVPALAYALAWNDAWFAPWATQIGRAEPSTTLLPDGGNRGMMMDWAFFVLKALI